MKRKIFSAVLAIVMVLTLAPVALAQEEAGPKVQEYSINVSGTDYTLGSSINDQIQIESNTLVTSLSIAVTFDQEVDFVAVTDMASVPDGAIYVRDVSGNNAFININIKNNDVDLNGANFSIELSTEDNGRTWKGDAPVDEIRLVVENLTLINIVNILRNPTEVLAGSVKSKNTELPNETEYIAFNQDAKNVYIRHYPASTTTYTVTYVCPSQTYIWILPAGIPIPEPIPPTYSTLTFDGWYMDATYTEKVTESDTVTGDMTIYGKYEGENVTFADQLTSSDYPSVTINSLADFETFANLASEASPNKLVILGTDIDCGGGVYPAIQYSGNFDGDNKTISNATFTPTGDDNCGMFDVIGKGQKIVNIIFEKVTIRSATNAGVVAGSVSSGSGDASQPDRPLIQNVQVKNCTVNGRNAGGIVGYTFLSDIKFCSVTNSTIAGLVNAGGIAAQSYSIVQDCYTDGLTLGAFFLSYTGGIVATPLEASNAINCWTTYTNIYGRNTQDRPETECIASAGSVDASDAFTTYHFSRQYWRAPADAKVSEMTFTPAVKYIFSE